MSSICVPIYVPFAFRFGVSLLCSIFAFFFFICYTVCTINPFRFVLLLFAFFFCLFFIFLPFNGPFQAHLIFFFLRNSMQFLSRWSCISKRKTTFEDILKCYQSHSNQGLNKLRRVRCWNGDVLEISLLVNLSFWLEIWSVFYVQWIQKWLKCVLIQKRRLL